jgi:hypothetical protein
MRTADFEEPDILQAGVLQPDRGLLGRAPDHVRIMSVRADRRDADEAF